MQSPPFSLLWRTISILLRPFFRPDRTAPLLSNDVFDHFPGGFHDSWHFSTFFTSVVFLSGEPLTLTQISRHFFLSSLPSTGSDKDFSFVPPAPSCYERLAFAVLYYPTKPFPLPPRPTGRHPSPSDIVNSSESFPNRKRFCQLTVLQLRSSPFLLPDPRDCRHFFPPTC